MSADLLRVTRKIGLGLRPEDDSSPDPLDWIEHQLTSSFSTRSLVSIEAPRPEIADWPSELMFDLDDRIRRLQAKRKRERQLDEMKLDEVERQRLWIENAREHDVHDQDICRFTHAAIYGEDQLRQRLTHFWLNHFAVGYKDVTPGLIGDYWDAIYASLDGTFRDMLYRTTTHPAMLVYLDNITNAGRRSEHVRTCNCVDGPNDNHARELLELHTVSPARGYAEDDVQECAKVLAGWGDIFELDFVWKQRPDDWSQAYISRRAEPGTKMVLGHSIPEGKGGLRTLIDALSGEDHTRLFISRKLAQHFIGEAATDADVGAIAAAWEASGGHLPTIHRATFARAIASPIRRFHWPMTWLFQALRLSGATLLHGHADVGTILMRQGLNSPTEALRELGQTFWIERQPNGFSEQKADWVSTEHLDRRYRFATIIARFGRPELDTEEILTRYGFSQATRDLVGRGQGETEKFVLLACSPEFMEV